MENFASFLKQSGLRQSDFADALGVSQATISRLARGEMKPGLELAVAIARATGDAVPVESWVDPTAPQ